MEITDIRVKLVNHSSDRLKAFCSVTLDDEFVIRDIKLVEGSNGLFVAMPSRKLTTSCPKCKHKNPLRARYCAECGAGLPNLELPVDDAGRLRLYRDIAHPITQEFREKLQGRIVEAYHAEDDRAADPDYEPDTAGVVDEFEEDEESPAKNTTETEETEETVETIEAAKPSEYNALIAGLDPGTKPREPQRTESKDSGRRQDDRGGAREGQRPRRRGEHATHQSELTHAQHDRRRRAVRGEVECLEVVTQRAGLPRDLDHRARGLVRHRLDTLYQVGGAAIEVVRRQHERCVQVRATASERRGDRRAQRLAALPVREVDVDVTRRLESEDEPLVQRFACLVITVVLAALGVLNEVDDNSRRLGGIELKHDVAQ